MQKKCKFLVGALLAWIPVTAQAQFGGNVGFGGAASGRSASVVFDNPAGMVRWETEDYRLGFLTVDKVVTFEGSSNKYLGPRVDGYAESNANNTAVNVYYVRPLEGDKWHLGFGFFTLPFVRDLQWDGLLSHLTKEKGNAYNIGPAFAYKVSDKFSVGASLNFEYLDFWCNMQLPEFGPDGPLPGIPGFMRSYGEDWELGYRVGLLYQFNEASRVGLAYYSVIDHVISGWSTYASPTVPERREGGYSLRIPVPPVAVLSAHHSINGRWAIAGSVSYTWWEPYWVDTTLSGLVNPPPFETLGGPITMQNTFGYSAGVEYDPPGSWGFVFQYSDSGGQSVDEYRSVKDYPNGHAAYIFGLRKAITEQISIDFGYQYVDGKDAPIVSPGSSGQGTVSGEFGMQQWHSNAVGLFLNVTPQKKSAGG